MSLGADLLSLQELDLTIARLEHDLKTLSQLDELAKKRATHAKLKAEATKLLARRKDAEMAVADLDEAARVCHEQVAAAQARQSDLSDYRAVQDLEIELSMLAKCLDKIAFDRPVAQEKLDELRDKERQLADYLTRFEDAIVADTNALREQASTLQGDIDAARAKRDKLVSTLPADAVSRYEAASHRLNGIAVERLEGNVPSVCRMALQTASMDELHHAADIAECPYCHRIIVLNEEA